MGKYLETPRNPYLHFLNFRTPIDVSDFSNCFDKKGLCLFSILSEHLHDGRGGHVIFFLPAVVIGDESGCGVRDSEFLGKNALKKKRTVTLRVSRFTSGIMVMFTRLAPHDLNTMLSAFVENRGPSIQTPNPVRWWTR